MVAVVWLQAVAWSFPIPGGDSARQGSARMAEAVGSRTVDVLRLPVAWMHASGTITWVLGSVLWGVVTYGIVLMLWRGSGRLEHRIGSH
jgi:hypothetical protein